ALPVRDRGVHRDHGADDGAEAEEERDDRAERRDEHRKAARLFLVVLAVLEGLEVELPVFFDRGFEGVEFAGALESNADRRNEAFAAERRADDVSVAPYFGLERRAAVFEHADDVDRAVLAQLERLAELDALEAAPDAFADDHFVGAGFGGA